MSSDLMVLAVAVSVLVISIAWGCIVAWCAWKLGKGKE
jgi:hypothetical protein